MSPSKFSSLTIDATSHINSLLCFLRHVHQRLRKNKVAQKDSLVLLESFAVLVDEFYQEYVNSLKQAREQNQVTDDDIPRLLNRAVRRLTLEWQQISPIISMSYLAGDYVRERVQEVVNAAAQNLGDEARQFAILPHPGYQFYLTQFHYAPHFTVLGIPVFNLDTEWELSVIWHELAGRKVSALKKQARQNKSDDPFAAILAEIGHRINKNNPQEIEVPQVLASDEKPGWSTAWVQELFEDGFSILLLGAAFLPQFERILRRLGKEADRNHPPTDIRSWFASYLLDEKKPIPQELADKYPDLLMIAQRTAQLLREHLPKPNSVITERILEAVRQRADIEEISYDPKIKNWLTTLRKGVDIGAIRTLLLKRGNQPFYEFADSPALVLAESDLWFGVWGEVVIYKGVAHYVYGSLEPLA